MIIKRFKLKEGRPTEEDLKRYNFRSGGRWIMNDSDIFVCYIWRKEDPFFQDYEISFNMAFKKDRRDFNDFDNILVLDEEFGQPYIPFYNFMNEKKDSFPFLDEVISAYNTWISKFDFLEEDVKDEYI